MRRFRRIALAGLSLTAGLTLVGQAAPAGAASPGYEFRACVDAAVEQEEVPAAIDDCVAAYLASLEAARGEADTVNTGILGRASNGGVNTGILGSADGDGAVNTGILGSAS
jgi:hypothetical protein